MSWTMALLRPEWGQNRLGTMWPVIESNRFGPKAPEVCHKYDWNPKKFHIDPQAWLEYDLMPGGEKLGRRTTEDYFGWSLGHSKEPPFIIRFSGHLVFVAGLYKKSCKHVIGNDTMTLDIYVSLKHPHFPKTHQVRETHFICETCLESAPVQLLFRPQDGASWTSA